MKRAYLERILTKLGWLPIGPSGVNHVAWAHPRKLHRLYVRQTAIIPVATAERILVNVTMMLIGRVAKEEGRFWSAHAELVGAFTHGESRREAFDVLAELIESMVDRPGFKVTIRDHAVAGDGAVVIEANEPALLAALVLKHQREVRGLTLAQVAVKLGASSRNAYARYEQGASVPTIDKLYELLAVVAPDVALVFEQREPERRGRRKRTSVSK